MGIIYITCDQLRITNCKRFNFIADNLALNSNLTDLYMMGNPAQVNWDKFNSYLIARLPQLKTLDGTEITRSMQIVARQKLPALSVGQIN